ncbi:MAG: AAA family ATPase [Chloroflexota bacterium]
MYDRPALVVAFGLPGAGKTYAARVFEEFGFTMHDGDDDLPDDMRAAIAASQPISDALRDIFFGQIIASAQRLWPENPKVVIAQTYIKEKCRQRFLDTFPAARFVLVEADVGVRERRLAHRTHQALDPDYVRKMDRIFELPQIPHQVISNNEDGDAHLKRQIVGILASPGSLLTS